MKREIQNKLYLILILFIASSAFSSWYNIRNLNDRSNWNYLEYDKFETQIKMNGLLYETTIHFKAKLGDDRRYNYDTHQYYCQRPYAGNYRWQWVFNFPEESYITQLEFWDHNTNAFIKSHPIDITTGESLFDPQSNQYPHVLLRQYRNRNYDGYWDQFYHLIIEPVDRDQIVEFKLTYLSPVQATWDRRRFKIRSKELYRPSSDQCVSNAPAVFYFMDLQNINKAPSTVDDFPFTWSNEANYWKTQTDNSGSYFYTSALLQAQTEDQNGIFLQTTTDENLSFYQLSTKPMIQASDMPSRHIVLCMDLVDQNYRWTLMNRIKDALAYPPKQQDSIWVLTSDFVVKSLDDDFVQCSKEHIWNRINESLNIIPELNTLPFILQEAVQILNNKGVPGEIWLVSNDTNHGYPAERANDIIQQTLGAATVPIQFRILDAASYAPYHYINNKSYRGNEYLYENLFRMTDGTFYKLRDYNSYDWKEAALDCFAPKVSTVEIDPVPTGGLSFSRFDLNQGRQSFHERSRYFQIGMYEGDTPFEVRYFGQFYDDLYHKDIPLDELDDNIDEEYKEWIKTYWYGEYIFNQLLEQPQTYENIKYIEELSKEHAILTPYSAFVIPGPDGYIGFNKLTAADSVRTEEISIAEDPLFSQPDEFSLKAYPNPFNPETKIQLTLMKTIKGDEKIQILNLLGQEVKTIYLQNYRGCIQLSVPWDGNNNHGLPVQSGTYLIRFVAEYQTETIKAVLIR